MRYIINLVCNDIWEYNVKSSLSLITVCGALLAGCASITNDAMVPVALSFSNGDTGECVLTNKRQTLTVDMPTTASIRRSDDDLRYDCTTSKGARAVGGIPSTMGGKIIASAVFIDFGITDAITDKHREYPASFVVPVK